jgi:hypothetical protein
MHLQIVPRHDGPVTWNNAIDASDRGDAFRQRFRKIDAASAVLHVDVNHCGSAPSENSDCIDHRTGCGRPLQSERNRRRRPAAAVRQTWADADVELSMNDL